MDYQEKGGSVQQQESDNKIIKVTPIYHDFVLNSDYDVVVQLGGRFSGKSHNEQIRLVANLIQKKDYKLLIIEDLESGISEGFHAGLYARIRDFQHDTAYTPETKVPHIKNILNGNTVIFRGYTSEQQKLNVKKLNGISEILVEEAEWMTYDDLMSLFQQLRGKNKEDRKLTLLLNPVNPDCFVNQYLIESTPDRVLKYFDGTNRPKVFEKNISTTFELDGEEITKTLRVLIVITTHFDNNYLTLEQRASIEQYKETDPDKYLQLGEARFIRSSGCYFQEFKRDTHVINPFPIPEHWKRYRTIDYGLDMLACYWIATDINNKAYVYKELYMPNLIISEAAKKIKEMTTEDKIYCTYAPPDLWNRRQETGKSAAEIFAENGVHLSKADNDRVQGWYNLKEWLKPYSDEQEIITASMVMTNNCENLIRCLSQIQKDEKDANDVATQPHELTHAPDSIRYFVAGRPSPTRIQPQGQHKKLSEQIGIKKPTNKGITI
jgi:phage terminase large subunit